MRFGKITKGGTQLYPATPATQRAEFWRSVISEFIPTLKKQNWTIHIADNFPFNVTDIELPPIEIRPDNMGWFSLGMDITVDGEQVSLIHLLHEFMAQFPAAEKGKFITLKISDSKWVRISTDELLPILDLIKQWYKPAKEKNTLKAPLHQLPTSSRKSWKSDKTLKKLANELSSSSNIANVKAPRGFQATFRDYQQSGFEWLCWLQKNQFGGILADDMGLGKTIQTLGYLLKRKQQGKLKQPALILAPTSVTGNWQQEAARFTPTLSTLVLYGAQRAEQFDDITQYNIIITSYPLIHRDIETHQEQSYSTLVLDEAQVIKNPRTRTAAAVRLLPADHKIALTGTPLENHLGELWSIFDTVLPGILGDQAYFYENYRKPIEQHGDEIAHVKLLQKISPFLLRRSKEEVALELPPKTEIIQRVNFTDKQSKLYESLRAAMEKRVRDLIQTKGVGRSHIEFLEALMRLRQVCCDPRLVEGKVKTTGKLSDSHSAKLQWIKDFVPEMIEEGRKILIFSQFTSMLSIIEETLKQSGIDTIKLTGSTKKRDAVITEFQTGDIPVFLISLKAGGVGLNLTSADTVIHYDPWWNPAVENQATDRAHRIGQEKPVFVYKLLGKDSIEEKVHELQKIKQQLADAIYSGQKASNALSEEDWLNLFSKD